MALFVRSITIDCPARHKLARWGRPASGVGPSHASFACDRRRLRLERVPEPHRGKAGAHTGLHSGEVALGTFLPADRHSLDGTGRGVLSEPEGSELCVEVGPVLATC